MIPALTSGDSALDLPQQDTMPPLATDTGLVEFAKMDSVPRWFENEHAIESALPLQLKCRQCDAIMADRDHPFDSLTWLMHGCEVQGCCEDWQARS